MTIRNVLVDANVVKSYADPGRHETSKACFALLFHLSTRQAQVEVALTPKLREEWERHASRQFTKWWAAMESRGRIKHHADKRLRDYRATIDQVEDDGVREALEKDAHLVEAALINRFPVASQDDKQLRYLRDLIPVYSLLASLQWFNPVTSTNWFEWMRQGCADTSAFTPA